MGNALRFLCGSAADADAAGHHGVTPATVGVSALAQHLYDFEITSQVPAGLGQHVVSSRKAQSNWYGKLSAAWREARPPPRTPEEASRLIIQTLKGHKKADVEGFLGFYGLPLPGSLVELTGGTPPLHQNGLRFELLTLPVDAKAVADGDTITVYVRATDPREASRVPNDVASAARQRSEARSRKNYARADELHQHIINSGYREIRVNEEEVLARKYRIRLRGIDAPESKMPFGRESKEELVKIVQGKSLRVMVFDEDRYGRCVGDVYCNGIFVQVWRIIVRNGMKSTPSNTQACGCKLKNVWFYKPQGMGRHQIPSHPGIKDSHESVSSKIMGIQVWVSNQILEKLLLFLELQSQSKQGQGAFSIKPVEYLTTYIEECLPLFYSIQEVMLKKGLAWHYTAYDKRHELAEWEKEARAKRIGLWASKNPEMPWEWRKERRENNGH